MKLAMIGLLPVFISVNVSGINYTPAWLGYVLILLGYARTPQRPGRDPLLTVSAVAALLSGALWAAGLFGYGMAFPLYPILQVMVTYYILAWSEGQEELDTSYHIARLRLSWYALVGASVASFVLGMVMPPLGWVWHVAAVCAGLFFTWTFYRLVRIAPDALQG